MTADEAKAQLLALLPLSAEQLAAAAELPPDELEAVVRGFGLAAQPEHVPALKSALDFVHAHQAALAFLGPVGLAIQGAIDVAELATGG